MTAAIKAKDLDAATDAKMIIEDAQRDATREREESGKEWTPRFFARKNGEYRPAFTYVPHCRLLVACRSSLMIVRCRLPKGSSKEQVAALRSFVYGDDPEPPATKF